MQLCYLLTGLKASILLAMGGWDRDDPGSFWAERFLCPVPSSLVDLLMPWYKQLQTTVAQADEKGTHVHFSARGILRLLPVLAYVAVQDALELCADGRPEEYKENPVHSLLLTNSLFRWVWQQDNSMQHVANYLQFWREGPVHVLSARTNQPELTRTN